MTLLGVISDTHGLLRPEALDALRGSDLIIHAGDVAAIATPISLHQRGPPSCSRSGRARWHALALLKCAHATAAWQRAST